MVKSINQQPVLFFLSPEKLASRTLRIDVHHYHPKYMETMGLIQNARTHEQNIKQLGEVTKITRILGFETERLVKYVDKGVPYLRVQNIQEFEIDLVGVKRISIDAHKKLKRSQLKPNDVVMTITGRVGTAAVIPSTIGECNASQEIVRIRVFEDILKPDYVAVYLNSEFGRRLLERWYSGSTRARTLIRNVRKIPIVIPSKEAQIRLVNKVMSLKQRRNKKLQESESISMKAQKVLQIAYKSVYDTLGIRELPPDDEKVFTLTRDKLGHRLDVGFYSSANKYSLQSEFPIEKMGEIADFSHETIIPQKEPLSKFRYVQIQDVDAEVGKIVSYTELLGRNTPSRARKIIRKGDILVAMTRARGSIAIVPKDFDGCVASTAFGVLKPRRTIDRFFLYFMLRSGYVLDEIKRRLTGVGTPAITISEFKQIEIPIPPTQIQKKIIDLMNTATEKSEKLKLQAKNLIERAEEIDQKAEREIRRSLSIETT